VTNFLGERGGGVLMHSSQKLPLNPVFCTHTAVFDQDLAQELPLDQTALYCVSEARVHLPHIYGLRPPLAFPLPPPPPLLHSQLCLTKIWPKSCPWTRLPWTTCLRWQGATTPTSHWRRFGQHLVHWA
jgi:hypothetical protein